MSGKVGIAIANFNGKSLPKHSSTDYLEFSIGAKILITTTTQGWCRGENLDTRKTGLFPENHVQLQAKNDLPFMNEIVESVKDWQLTLKKLFKESAKNYPLLKKACDELINTRREINSGLISVKTPEEIKTQCSAITKKIDYINSQLLFDIVPRTPDGIKIDVDTYLAYKIYNDYFQLKLGTTEPSDEMHSALNKFSEFHLQAMVKDIDFKIENSSIEVFFGIYEFSDNKLRLITQRYHFHFDSMSSACPQFLLTGLKDSYSNKYIVAQVYRIGAVHMNNEKPSGRACRRPYGVGVQNLTEYMKRGYANEKDGTRFTMKIICPERESTFSTFHESLIDKDFSGDPSSHSLTLILKKHVGKLEELKRRVLTDDIVEVPRILDDDEITPDDKSNEVFVTMEKADFKNIKNLEVSMEVSDFDRNKKTSHSRKFSENCADSDRSHKCIYVSCGVNPVEEYYSPIYYHSPSPVFMETVRVAPPNSADDHWISRAKLHLLFLFYEVSSTKSTRKLFGFSYLPFMKDNSLTIEDGTYTLNVFQKSDSNKSIEDISPSIYLSQSPFQNSNKQSEILSRCYPIAEKDKFVVTVKIRAHLFTSSPQIHSLLTLKESLSTDENVKEDRLLQEIKNINLKKLPSSQVFKFETKIIDNLISSMEILSRRGSSLGDIFKLFLLMVKPSDYEVQKISPYILSYLEHDFHCESAFIFLSLQIQTGLQEMNIFSLKVIQSLNILFKFICKSYLINEASEITRIQFKQHIHQIFKQFQSCRHNISEMNMVMECIINVTNDVTAALRASDDDSQFMGELIIQKLIKPSANDFNASESLEVTQNIVVSELFQINNKGARSVLLQKLILDILKSEIGSQTKQCCEMIGSMYPYVSSEWKSLDEFKDHVSSEIPQLNDSIFHLLMEKFLEMEQDALHRNIRCELGAVLATLMQLMQPHHLKDLFTSFIHSHGPANLKSKIFDYLRMCTHLLDFERLYYADWVIWCLAIKQILLGQLSSVSNVIFTMYEFDEYELKVELLNVIFLFLQQSIPLRRKHHDIREDMCDVLLRTWSRFSQKTIFNLLERHDQPLLSRFITASCIDNLYVCKKMFGKVVEIFHQAKESNKVDQFQKLVLTTYQKIATTDQVLSLNLTETYRDLFFQYMREELAVHDFTKVFLPIVQLLELLIDYCTVTKQSAFNDNKFKKGIILQYLMEFFERHNIVDVACSYLQQLLSLNEKILNHVELGKCYYKLSQFNDEERYENLHRTVKCFIAGLNYANALIIANHQMDLYSKENDYIRLSEVHAILSDLYKNMSEVQENVTEYVYFCLRCIGTGCNYFSFRNKMFIIRVEDTFRWHAFAEWMEREFPYAQIDKSYVARESTDKFYLQIFCVNMIRSYDKAQLDNLPIHMHVHWERQEANRFIFDRTVIRGGPDLPDVEKLNYERWVLTTTNSLPSSNQASEAEIDSIVYLNSVQVAIDFFSEKYRAIVSDRELAEKFPQSKKFQLNLQTKLNGTILAQVSGGFNNYMTFFTDKFKERNPHVLNELSDLKDTIAHLLDELDRSMAVCRKAGINEQLFETMDKTLKQHFKAFDIERKGSRQPRLSYRARASTSEAPTSSALTPNKKRSTTTIITTTPGSPTDSQSGTSDEISLTNPENERTGKSPSVPQQLVGILEKPLGNTRFIYPKEPEETEKEASNNTSTKTKEPESKKKEDDSNYVTV